MVSEAVEFGLVGTQHLGVRTVVRLEPSVAPMMLDRIQIGQVIINLVRNAVEAMEDSETRELTVSTMHRARRGRDRLRRHRPGHFAGNCRAAVSAFRHVEGDRARTRPVDLPRA